MQDWEIQKEEIDARNEFELIEVDKKSNEELREVNREVEMYFGLWTSMIENFHSL